MPAIKIDRIRAFALTCTVAGGPVSSLAAMPTRNGLLVELTTADGGVGWGEAWCNFPPQGNLAKLSLLREVIGPHVLDSPAVPWDGLRPMLEQSLARMILHVGEPGPFAHCFAALDTAMADICARAADIPLSRFLSAEPADTVGVYASTPDVRSMADSIAALVESGHNATKLKIGFAGERDPQTLSAFRKVAPAGMALMVDANQNWTPEAARAAIARISQWNPEFVEEPIRADSAIEDWVSVAQGSPIPLAAGENICSIARFAKLVETGGLQVIQPDLAKWGGVSGTLQAGRHALDNKAACSMHYMGTALGLAASAHVLAAIGGTGWVELDANPNPLRTDLGRLDLRVHNGRIAVPSGPGIGFVPDQASLEKFAVAACDIF